MKKVIALLAGAAMISLCGWFGGAHAERERIRAEFASKHATVLVHCGPINEHESVFAENVPPPQSDMQRVRKAFEAADDMHGYVTVLGKCAWRDDNLPSRYTPLVRPFP